MAESGPHDHDNRALIIGAGPAGITAGIALGRVGISAALFERGTEFHLAGAGAGVQSNALRALERLGARDGVESAGVQLRFQETYDSRGKLLFTMPRGEVSDEYGTHRSARSAPTSSVRCSMP